MAETTLSAETAGEGQPDPGLRGRRRTGDLLLRSHAAVIGGVLIFLAFPPVNVWPLAPVGVGVTTLALLRERPRFAAFLGFLAGAGMFVPLLSWVRVIGMDAWLGLAVLQAGYLLLLGVGIALVTRLPGWPLWVAALWVAEEALRGRFPLGGFTWGRLAFSQGDSGFTPYASLAGAPIVSFLVALTGCLLACAALAGWRLTRGVAPRRPARVWLSSGAAVVAVAVPAAGYTIPLPSGGADTARVAAVQGGVAASGMTAARETPPRAVLENHVEATRQLASRVADGQVPQPDFVVWPENASDLDPLRNAPVNTLVNDAVDAVDVPVLTGAIVGAEGPGPGRNVGIVWKPSSGAGESYVKRHLVPFGEYIPFRDVLLPYFERLRMASDFTPGHQPGVLDIAGTRIADAICFDIAYDRTVREAVVGGGRLITVQTNNNTYVSTAQPEQQLAIERLRAVEHGRAVVVAAISGISAIISPDGQLVQVSDGTSQQVLMQRLPLRSELTLADKVGAVPEWVLVSAGLLAVVVAVTDSRRRQGRES